jgi:hypothetical protein
MLGAPVRPRQYGNKLTCGRAKVWLGCDSIQINVDLLARKLMKASLLPRQLAVGWKGFIIDFR